MTIRYSKFNNYIVEHMNSTSESINDKLSLSATGGNSDPRDRGTLQDPAAPWEENSVLEELNESNSTVANKSNGSLKTVYSSADPPELIPPLSSAFIGRPNLRPRLKTSLDAQVTDDLADCDDFNDEALPELSTDGEDVNEDDIYIEDDVVDQFQLPSATVLNDLPPLDIDLSDGEEDRPESAASIITVKHIMARPTVAMKKALNDYERAITTFDVVFADLEPPNTPAEELKDLQRDATEQRKALIDTISLFATDPHDDFTDAKHAKASTYCTHYSNKIKLIYIQVKQNEDLDRRHTVEATQQLQLTSAGDYRQQQSTMSSQRVVRLLPPLKQNVLDINAKFTEVRLQPCSSAIELKGLENAFKTNCDLMQECCRQIDDLNKNATSANDPNSIEIMDGLSISLYKSKRDTRKRLDDITGSFGILPGMIELGIKNINVEAPIFSGVFSEEPDYFTFCSRLNEYFSHTGALSTAQKLLKLRNDCLKSPAKECVATASTYDVAMHLLKSHFGKPTMVFMNKVQDLKACGKCPEKIVEKRDWVFKVTQKIKSLTTLAQDHGLTMMFESTNIVGVLQKIMLAKDHEDFRKLMRDEMRAKPEMVITRGYTLEAMLGFLEDIAIDTNYDIDYMAATSYSSYRELLDGMKGPKLPANDKSKEPSKDSRRSTQYKKYATMAKESDDLEELYDLDEMSEDSDDNHGGPVESASDCHSQPIMSNYSEPRAVKCKLCDHSHTNLAYCKDFQDTPVSKRWRKIMKMKACYRCLRTDAGLDMDNRSSWLKAHLKNCSDKWLCNEERCADKDDIRKNHIIICRFHQEENKKLENEFISTLDKTKLECDVKFFLASYMSTAQGTPETDAFDESVYLNGKDPSSIEIEPEVKDCPIYQLQYISGKNNEKLLVFYDTGCWSSGLSNNAYTALDTVTVREGPTTLQVAAGAEISIPYGEEKFWLPLDGKTKTGKDRMATFSGLRMENVSCPFPNWPLRKVYDDISAEFAKLHPTESLPSIEDSIGNKDVDVMIGIKFNKYHPKLLFSLPGGLEIRRAVLKGWNGNQAVLAGPHHLWQHVAASSSFMGPGVYLSFECKAYRVQCDALWNNLGPVHEEPMKLSPPNSWSLFCKCGELIDNPLVDDDRAVVSAMYAVGAGRQVREYKLLDEIGAELGYRCIKCRGCNPCKDGERLEEVSLKEEQESYQIKNCVSYNATDKVVMTDLPFIHDPATHLADNKHVAMKILDSQVKLATKDDTIKEEILKSFQKLVDNGHLVKISDLTQAEKELTNKPGYWIPWRAVHSSSSISTPCRLVFDASSRTKVGYSLNDCLAKGDSKLANLLHLLIQFRKGKAALSADIRMAYNTIKLKSQYYRYQKMLWKDFLSIDGETIEMVIKTLIYGVKPAGQLTAEGFNLVADVAEEREPDLKLGADTLRDKKYVDDILASYETDDIRDLAGDSLERTLDYGSMEVKAVTKSGYEPDEKVTTDGVSCGLLGYKWLPKEDLIGPDIKPLYLGKRKRGKCPPSVKGDVKQALSGRFTKRVIVGTVAVVFDPLGVIVPVTARLKLDLSEICKLKVDWDDALPVELLDTWVHNLDQIQLLADFKVPRSIFSYDVDIDNGITLLILTDASQSIAVATVYAQMNLNSGGKICNLIISKSKLVTKLTVPKAELKACNMGCVLANLVQRDFGECVKRVVFATDSVIALYWMNCDSRPLQTSVRNMVIDIRRLCKVENWHHIESALNPADIATRTADASLVTANSEWQLGKDWMQEEVEEMPLKTLTEISMDQEEQRLALLEIRNSGAPGLSLLAFNNKVSLRTDFSEYLVDPMMYNWNHLLRRTAIVMIIADIWKGVKSRNNTLILDKPGVLNVEDVDIERAKTYLFKKTTKELFEFNEWKKIDSLGEMKNGIFMYTGRILTGHEADLADCALDLSRLSFAVPVVDRNSPVAYSIMKTCHEKLTHHGGSVSTLLKSYEFAFILGGRSLATEIKTKCNFCQRYRLKTIQIEMGKLDAARYTVAPAFTICQLDLFGPYDMKCQVHQRQTRNTETAQAWGVAIKCCATNALGLYVMIGYDTDNFLLAFQRHIYRYGTPLQVRIDAGSQLIKGFKEMKIYVADVARTINAETSSSISFKIAPPGAHNWNGMAERSIKEIKKMLNTVFKGRNFSAIQFETALAYVASELNNLPFCLGNRYTNLDGLDLLTPSRLLMGRNKGRTAMGRVTVESPGKMMSSIDDIEKAWWEVFKNARLADFFPKSKKWTHTSYQPRVGQIVVFLRDLSNAFGSSIFRIGKIKQVFESKDGIIRKVEIEYRLWLSKTTSTVMRSLRDVAVLEIETDLDLGNETKAGVHMDLLWSYFN